MKSWKSISNEEDGQVLVLFALMIAVLLGFAALTIDVGMVAFERSNLRNAADAAALAAVQDLPHTVKAENAAMAIAEKNGVSLPGDSITVTTPYKGDSTKVEVIVTRNVKYTFARVLGFSETVVRARAVAKKNATWNGEALPFVNLDDDYKSDKKIEAWEKTGPGDFESLWPTEYHMFNLGNNEDHSKGYFTIDYEDGIEITKGTVATIKQEVGYIFEQHKPVYIFSLSSDVIKSKKYDAKLKNKDIIPLNDLVLLQVTFDSYDYSGKTLYLTAIKEFDIKNGIYPEDYLNGNDKGTYQLVE